MPRRLDKSSLVPSQLPAGRRRGRGPAEVLPRTVEGVEGVEGVKAEQETEDGTKRLAVIQQIDQQ